ncbi:MAG TPA: nickel pincer cofactor biosynthesis protein LarC [Candidatus Bathyarchaeia archaeon]
MKALDNLLAIIDANSSGVSGDKYLGALVSIGGRVETLKKVAGVVAENTPGTASVKVDARRVERGDIGAYLVTIKSDEKEVRRKGSVILSSAEKCARKLGLSNWGYKFSLSTIETLLQAESKVHGHSPKEVELEELGSADTLIDVLGVARLSEELGLANATWWSTPVAVGGGTSTFSDRSYPNPPPAVAEILRASKFPMVRGHGDQELSTPTGVAITVNLVGKYSQSHPALRPDMVGYGAGSKDIDGVANILRIMAGQTLETPHSHDEVVILETNIDDVTGEILGRAAERLMAQGARDVTITPVYMKKNRPGHVVTVIAKKDDAEDLAQVLIAETGTLGVREIPVNRHISPRTSRTIHLRIGDKTHQVGVKIAEDRKGRAVGFKVEYDDLRRISDQNGISVLKLQRLANPLLESLEKGDQ